VVYRALNCAMCALFLLAVVVQWNDPDPLQWMAIYGAAFVVCMVVARRGRIHVAAPAVIMVIAVAWSVALMAGGPDAGAFSHMFDTWEMKAASVEEAREETGLLIVGAWMLVVAVKQRLTAGAKS